MLPLARITFFSLLPLGVGLAAEPGTGLPKYSPFEARGGAGPAVAAASETIEFAGISSIGSRTDLIFYDKTLKKSHWIGLGETKNGIEVVGYDARREQATIKLNGAQKVLPLRKGAAPARGPAAATPMPVGFNLPPPGPQVAGPMPLPSGAMNVPPATATPPAAPSPNPPAAPVTPETQAKQETEARMLVSDLLEIGMAQRKAYEEAQRKAADGTPPAPAPANQSTPPAPTPEKPN
jgi:hypothetical protein